MRKLLSFILIAVLMALILSCASMQKIERNEISAERVFVCAAIGCLTVVYILSNKQEERR